MSFKSKAILLVIFIFSLFIRLWKLDSLPISLNWDEVSHGYTAYSLAVTGKDQWGISWPIFNTRAYGDYPTMVNIYLTLPLVKFFGLNAWTTRLPTALLGSLLIPLTYLLCLYFTKNEKTSLLSALLSSISPWFFFTSRFAIQSTVALFFFLLGLCLLLYSPILKKKWLFLFGSIFLAFSSYAYHNTRLIVPIIFLGFLLIYRRQIFDKKHSFVITLVSIVAFLVIVIPQLLNFLSPEARARSQWVFILNDSAINYLNTMRGQVPDPIGRLIYNKLTYLSSAMILNYVNFLNPIPLFFQGTGNFQFNIPYQGLLFSICLPFFYFGLVYYFIKQRHQDSLFLFFWLLVGSLPAALTVGDFPSLRLMTILPIPLVFISLGITKTFNPKRVPTILFYLFIIGVFIQFSHYLRLYLTDYPINHADSWQYGYRQAVDIAKKYYDHYDQIVFTKKYGEPHEFILFFWPWDPQQYQQDNNKRWNYHSNWYWVDAFDKFLFINDWEMLSLGPTAKTLMITSPNNYDQNTFHLIDKINYPNGQTAFDIVTND